MSHGELTAPVTIVGGGPVGMLLAMQLDAWGVRCVVVNSEPKVRWHPKGNTHNARTMEHYRRLGIAEDVRRLGLPDDWPTDVLYFSRFNSHLLARLPMPSSAEKRAALTAADTLDQVPEPIHRANQMYVETFLFEHLATLPNVEMRYGWTCTGFTDEGDRVVARIERADGQAAETVTSQWLVGCDGGSSETRKRLDIRFSGEGGLDQIFFGRDMLASHVRVPALHRGVLKRRGWQYWAINDEVIAALVALDGKDDFLLHGRLLEGQSLDDARLVSIVQAAAGEPVDVEVVGNQPWTGGLALVADTFQKGRVVLAGDAVHLFTPTGGFGMNTGLDDTANLAWKLAADIQGWAGSDLMASYEVERRPIALRNTGAAHKLARNVADIPLGPDMESDLPEAVAARKAAGAYLAGFGEEFASIGIQLGARYDGSPIVVGDGGAPPADDPAIYVPSSVPGGRTPHAWVTAGDGARASLFDLLGRGFTLLRLGGSATSADPLVGAAKKRGVPLSTRDVPGDALRDLYERDLVLVRPDQHVAWRGNALPEDADTLLAQVTGGMRR